MPDPHLLLHRLKQKFKEMFLEPDQLSKLTGRKTKSLQIKWLRLEGIPFRINATGHPVVTIAAIEGKPEPKEKGSAWVPRGAAN